MHQSIKNGVMIIFLATVFSSCNQGESLQSYYVNNQETPNFISVDIPTSFVKIDETELTEEQLEAYHSIDKLNMLGYSISEDEEEYKTELAKVQTILNNEKYEDLMRGGNSKDGKIIVKMIPGANDTIDELIVFGSASNRGFAIVRVLGDKMDPSKIMKLGNVLSKVTTEENDVSGFMDFFKMDSIEIPAIE
jgi:hypothetical protein